MNGRYLQLNDLDKDPSVKALDKVFFPTMVKDLLERMEPKRLLREAFGKCGLVPLDREEVLSQIPCLLTSQQIARHVDSQLIEKLEVRRFGDVPKRKGRG